jgi:hypothetical protein
VNTLTRFPQTTYSGNNPQWGGAQTVFSLTTNTTNRLSYWWAQYGGHTATTNGTQVVWNRQTTSTNRYPHLYGVKNNQFIWYTLPEVCMTVPDYRGSFPCINDAKAGMDFVKTEGQHIIVGYYGNYTLYGAQMWDVFEDGMIVGQFGNRTVFGGRLWPPAHPGNWGNSGLLYTTSTNGGNDVYVYMGDESYAPCHRWHISNYNSIHEWTGSAALGPNATAALTQVF